MVGVESCEKLLSDLQPLHSYAIYVQVTGISNLSGLRYCSAEGGIEM